MRAICRTSASLVTTRRQQRLAGMAARGDMHGTPTGVGGGWVESLALMGRRPYWQVNFYFSKKRVLRVGNQQVGWRKTVESSC